MKTKISELTGVELDWAVVECEGFKLSHEEFMLMHFANSFNYSTNWSQGGPIIEREGIQLTLQDEESDVWWADGGRAHQTDLYQEAGAYGRSALIAAMRCYVQTKMGEELKLPKEFDGREFS